MAWRIDTLALAIAVRSKIDLQGQSQRQAGIAAGVDARTIQRARKGILLDAASTLALCKWLRIDPMPLLVARETPAATERRRAHEPR